MTSLKYTKTLAGEYLGPDLTMINRHGLIAGATGTGKTITVKKFAELLSNEGVPTFLIDVKGDLNSFGVPGVGSSGFEKHVAKFGESLPDFEDFPSVFWDIYGEKGLPVRTTVSNMGPLLISSLMGLNDIQTSVMHTLFKYADEEGLLILDFKDLKALVEFAYEGRDQIPKSYGLINKSSVGAIIRQINALDSQGVDVFFGERELELYDLMQEDRGKGVINVLNATKLFMNGQLYSAFLLWLLSELYEQFEEVGDVEKPKMVFFFDEAHIIFNSISSELLGQIEQAVRLIRSKGIGIYFITQSPTDIPDSVLSQLGNRVQHALRAYTAKEIRNLKLAAQGFRVNPNLDIEKAMLELGVGEAIVSFLDTDGVPGVTQRAFVLSPQSLMGMAENVDYFPDRSLNSRYRKALDRDSAYEEFARRSEAYEKRRNKAEKEEKEGKKSGRKSRGRPRDSFATKVGKSVVNSLSRRTGSLIARSIFGILKK